jgi:hypothetical protein
MPRDGTIREKDGGISFPIKLRCASLNDLMSEPALEPALTRALGRAFARARSVLPAALATGDGVVLQPPVLIGRGIPGDQATTLLARVQRAIDAAARAQSLPWLAAQTIDDDRRLVTGSPREIAERFDPKRYDPQTASYQVPSYQGSTKQVPARSQASPFDHLLSLLGTALDALDQFIKEQVTLSGIANQQRRDQWWEMRRALADLVVERKATQAVADVFAGKLNADKVTGPDREMADRVVKKYHRKGARFPARELIAHREAQLELGNTLLNVVRGHVKELDRKAAEYADEASRNAFLDVGSYYLELIGFAPQIGIERLAFLETFYSDPQVILVYAVLRFIRQELPELWDNLKLGTIFVLSDIGNTNMLSSYALGFPPGSAEAAQIVVINRALWIQGELYDQKGSEIHGDLPKSQDQVGKVPDGRLASLLSANILQLIAEVPVLVLLKNVQLLINAINKDKRVGVTFVLGDTSERDGWLKELDSFKAKFFDELRRKHDHFEHDRLVADLDPWKDRIKQLGKAINDELRKLELIGLIVGEIPFLFVGGAFASGFGAWVGTLTRGSRLLIILSEGVAITLFNALTAPPEMRPTSALGWGAQLGTNILLAGIGRLFQALGPAGQGLASSRQILLRTAVQAGGAFAATTLVQTAIQALESHAQRQGGESSFTEMLTLNAIMNGLGLFLGAAVHIDPAGPPGSRALAVPSPEDLAAQWTARGVPIDKQAAQEWLALVNRSGEFHERYQRLAKAARNRTLTKQELEDWRTEGLKLADDLEAKVPRLAKILGSTADPEKIKAYIDSLRSRIKSVQYDEPIALLPEYAGLTQVGDGPTWTYDPARVPRALSLIRKSAVGKVRDLPGGGFEVTDATSGRLVFQVVPSSAAVIRALPPSLEVIAKGARTEEGLVRVRSQTAAPELSAQLAQSAAKFGANPIRRLLQAIARGDVPPSDQAFRGLSEFLRGGGDPRIAARTVTIAGDRTGRYAASLFEQMASWDASAINGLSIIYEARPRTTGEEIGVLLGDFPPNDVRTILQSIDQLARHAEKTGFRRLIGQLMREFTQPQRFRPSTVAVSPTQIGARGVLAVSVELLRRFPGRTLAFEVPGLTPLGAIRIEDIVILDPFSGVRILGFEVKEVTSAFLGPRAPKQLAADIARDAAARDWARQQGVDRKPYETFRWRVRRFELEEEASKRLRSRGVSSPTASQLDTEMRSMIRERLKSTFNEAEVKNLPPAVQAEYRTIFDQSIPFLEFDETPAPKPSTPPVPLKKTAKTASAKPKTPSAKPATPPAPKPAPKQSQRVLAPKQQLTRAQTLENLEKKIETEGAALRKSQDTISTLDTKLKTLAANPVSRPPELDQDFRNLARIQDSDQRLAELTKLQQRPGLSSAADSYLKWLREVWTTRAELQDTTEGNRRAGAELERLRKVERPRAEAALRAASRAVKDFLRTEGPNYKKRRATVNYDEIIGKARWDAKWGASSGKRPALATDHLVALDRIANLSELTEFLLIFEKSSDEVKAKMTEDLIGLGDIESNLVRMRKDANESKSNKSWNDVTYEQVKKYGYENNDVDDMREREGKELETIKQKIAEMTAKYR